MARFGFDVSEVEVSERGDFEVLPKGEYRLRATEAELKDTSKGDGKYIAVTFEIHSGEAKGRKIWQNFNIMNPSEKAEQIGREQVAGWARAAGKPNAKDSDELIDRPFSCILDIEKGTGGYKDKNIIKSFLTGEAKSAPAEKKPASKFEDEPEEKPAKEEKKAPKEKAEQDAPASSKKNPWDD